LRSDAVDRLHVPWAQFDVLRIEVSPDAGEPEQRDQAGRLLDLLLDGLRYRRA
jgi:hypothetical protein